MTEREALKLALEVFKATRGYFGVEFCRQYGFDTAITAIEEALAQPEPVAWPCLIAESDFSENTITLTMQCTDYKVSAGKHWLSTTPPQRTWVWLTDEEERQIKEHCTTVACVLKTVKAKLKEKNT